MRSHTSSPADYRVDGIDRCTLYTLAGDARNTAAPAVAEEVEVTPATIRNRIRGLEGHGILRGYPADDDYERVGGRVTYQFTCTALVSDRDRLAQAALEVPGVVTVRQLMTGHETLTITVVGTDTDDVSRIVSKLSDLGLEIDDEGAIDEGYHGPYHPVGPDVVPARRSLTDVVRLADGAEVVEFTVSEGASIAGLTLEDAVSEDSLADEMLVVVIERDGEVITPRGETAIQSGDVVSLFSNGPLENEARDVRGAH